MTEQPTKKRIKPITKPTRSFQGNKKYLNFYNQFVDQTFKPQFQSSDLTSNFITNSGNTYPYNIDNITLGEEGTKWSSIEKEIFFNLLNKYSTISRILSNKDIWLINLPNKSMIEIIQYFKILSNKLKKFKKNKKLKLKLIKYLELPISFEISPFMLKFESLQSELISIRENYKLSERNDPLKKLNLELDSERSIIDINTIFKSIKNINNMSIDSLVLFEKLSKLIIKKIINNVLLYTNYSDDDDVKKKKNSIKAKDIRTGIECLNYNHPDIYFHIKNSLKLPDKLITISPFIDELQEEDDEKPKQNTIKSLMNLQQLKEDEKIEKEYLFLSEGGDSPLERYLNYKETQELERQDLENSRMYERGLIMMLMSDELRNEQGFNEEDEELANVWIDQVRKQQQEEELGVEMEEEETLDIENSDDEDMEIDDEIKRITNEAISTDDQEEPTEEVVVEEEESDEPVEIPVPKSKHGHKSSQHSINKKLTKFSYKFASY